MLVFKGVFPVIIYLLIAIVCYLAYVYIRRTQSYDNSNLDVSHVPIVILKLPRSGSSWFTESLNNYPFVFISKEIMQRGDAESFPKWQIENHLISALRFPIDKLASRGNLFPNGRYIEDYLLHSSLKPFQDLKVIGFTLNPEHCEGINWSRIAKAVPNMKVIMLIRSNIIKSAISGFIGKRTKEGCGSANLRWSNVDCNFSTDVNWSLNELTQEITSWQNRYLNFEKNVENDPTLQKHLVSKVYYEDLQENMFGTVQTMFDSIGMDTKVSPVQNFDNTQVKRKSLLSSSQWQKRSPENLANVLTQYNTIEKSFIKGNCSCLLEQLKASKPKTFVETCKEKYISGKFKCAVI